MCLYWCVELLHYISYPLRAIESTNDKLDIWKFLKSYKKENDQLPHINDFVINPMRESSTEVIIGGDHIIF